MPAEIVIFDVLKKAEFIELASEITYSAGFEPVVVGRTTKAQDALHYDTVGLVATVGWRNGFKPDEHEGIMLLSMANILDIPKALVDDDNVDDKVRNYIRGTDILLPRQEMDEIDKRLGKWIYNLAGKK